MPYLKFAYKLRTRFSTKQHTIKNILFQLSIAE